jgi:hypothetical protein
MPDFCTCGAELPPDARFCHKCGKPQRPEPAAEMLAHEAETSAAAATLAPARAAAVLQPLSFRNPVALRVGFLAAGLVSFLMMIPGVNYASIVWLLGAGYFSVWIYKRRTGQRLSVRGGARMGWITGVLSFSLVTLIFTFSLVAIQRAGGLAVVKDRLRELAIQQSAIDEMVKLVQNPFEILRSLAIMFLVMTIACTAGGALGAKILSKD